MNPLVYKVKLNNDIDTLHSSSLTKSASQGSNTSQLVRISPDRSDNFIEIFDKISENTP